MFTRKPNAWDDTHVDQFRQKDADYGQFLRKRAEDIGDPLLDYFGVDFFHDGEISELSLLSDDKLVISCPNIRRGDSFLVQRYAVMFIGVMLFSMKALEHASLRTFLGGEVDLVEEPLKARRKLIFLTDPEAWVEVIFDQIDVQPIDNILREDDVIPTYSYWARSKA